MKLRREGGILASFPAPNTHFFYMKTFCLSLCCLILISFSQKVSAQLSPADSAYFLNIFTYPIYMDDSVNPGNWYLQQDISSMYNHYLAMDTGFKFKTADLDSIAFISVNDNYVLDTDRNASFAQYPTFLNEADPMIYLPFDFLNKHSNAYAIKYHDTTQQHCRYAFLLVPGNGHNQTYELAQGTGYHNQLCQMKNHCIQYGDVFAFQKPNQESRAIHWNGKRLDDYLIWYLNTAFTPYGINYLVEIIAWVKYLQAHYDKVFVFGLSEGGYSTMLTSMYTQPDAVIISGGYSVGLDTNLVENSFLRTRFDYLVDTFHKAKVLDRITNTKTKYLFTWGENDPVPPMDPDHDFHLTENYFGPQPNVSYFYDFYDHTFPPCTVIDTFIDDVLNAPLAHFTIVDSSLADTLFTKVQFCRQGSYSFDLFKDTSLVSNYTAITDSVLISLSDSGKYYIKNITDSNNIAGKCRDTVWCTKQATPLWIALSNNDFSNIRYNNPVHDQLCLDIINPTRSGWSINIFNAFGQAMYSHTTAKAGRMTVPCSHWSAGLYFLQIRANEEQKIQQIKLTKW